nr:hypothetical protein [Psychromonas marina]
MYLGAVDLCRLNFVQPKGQHLLTLSTAFSPIYVEQPHDIGSALHKKPINCCKKKLETSTTPSYLNRV